MLSAPPDTLKEEKENIEKSSLYNHHLGREKVRMEKVLAQLIREELI